MNNCDREESEFDENESFDEDADYEDGTMFVGFDSGQKKDDTRKQSQVAADPSLKKVEEEVEEKEEEESFLDFTDEGNVEIEYEGSNILDALLQNFQEDDEMWTVKSIKLLIAENEYYRKYPDRNFEFHKIPAQYSYLEKSKTNTDNQSSHHKSTISASCSSKNIADDKSENKSLNKVAEEAAASDAKSSGTCKSRVEPQSENKSDPEKKVCKKPPISGSRLVQQLDVLQQIQEPGRGAQDNSEIKKDQRSMKSKGSNFSEKEFKALEKAKRILEKRDSLDDSSSQLLCELRSQLDGSNSVKDFNSTIKMDTNRSVDFNNNNLLSSSCSTRDQNSLMHAYYYNNHVSNTTLSVNKLDDQRSTTTTTKLRTKSNAELAPEDIEDLKSLLSERKASFQNPPLNFPPNYWMPYNYGPYGFSNQMNQQHQFMSQSAHNPSLYAPQMYANPNQSNYPSQMYAPNPMMSRSSTPSLQHQESQLSRRQLEAEQKFEEANLKYSNQE